MSTFTQTLLVEEAALLIQTLVDLGADPSILETIKETPLDTLDGRALRALINEMETLVRTLGGVRRNR